MSSPSLSILHLTAGSDAGGLSRYILDLSTAMRAQGHRVAVAGDVGVWQDKFDAAGIDYLRIPLKGGPMAVWRSIRQTRRFVAGRGGFDVYHAHYRRAALLGRALQQKASAPLLCTVHLSHINVHGLRRLLTDLGDHTHFASVDALEWACAHRLCERDRSSVIPHGIDLTRFCPPTESQRSVARQAFDLPADARTAVYVGRLDDPKNVDWLLDVAAGWNESTHGPLRLLIAGDGPHRQRIDDRVQRNGLSSRVRLLGEVDPLPVYHAADALLLPSMREGFSYVCAEALACGVPVLRTRTSGTSETIIEGVTGRSVDIDRTAFINAALAFLRDGDRLHAMRPAAAAHAAERFAMERQVRETVQMYRALAHRWNGSKGRVHQ